MFMWLLLYFCVECNAVGSDSHWPGWADARKLSEAGVRRSSGNLFL